VRQICATCRYWSEGHARLLGHGPLQALCLARHSPNRNHWVTGAAVCPVWRHDLMGKVDGPPDDGLFARRAYAKET
jgi:hypothetical protein